ncbi:MAG: hypothetical protein A2X77_04385 [Gammaproteobacteria bacterium GWE2_42_36]|nr:MAG: hypothetical protein A2X77_04385 [Gammaproteobacteria bacterium GWE2_42_36]
MTQPFIRELSPTENRLYLLNLITPHNVIFIAEFSGKLDVEILREAIKRLQKKHAMLSVSIENEPSFKPKFCSLPTGTDTPLSILHDDNIQNCWTEKTEQLLIEQLNQKGKPLFKVVQVNFGTGFYLFLVLQHLICDGKSLMALFQELLDEIDTIENQLDVSPVMHPFAPPINELFPDLCGETTSLGPLFDNPNESKYRSLYLHIPISQRNTGFVNLTLSKREFTLVYGACKKKQISLHAFLCACLCLMLRKNLFHFQSDLNDSVHIGCNSLIDARPFLKTPLENNILGFYSSCILADYKVDKQADIWALARFIEDDIKRKKDSYDFIKRMKRHETFTSKFTTPEYLIESMRVDEPALSVSNLGKINLISPVKNLHLVNCNVAGSCHAHSRNQDTFFITILSFANQLSINLHYVKPIIPRERAEHLLTELYKILLS